jgi:hypothetical protein
MLATLQQILDSIPYPTAVGCVAIGLGFIVAGLASPLKSKADRARKARAPEKRAPAKTLRIQFALTLLCGALLTAGGTWLTHNGARLESERTRKENEQARKDLELRIQNILVALNAAKAEQNRLLTDEKIKGFSKDVLQWADDFQKRKPDKQREFEQARIAATQQEVQISSDSMPVLSFALQSIQQIVEAIQKKSGETFKISLRPFSQNFYDSKINSPSRTIQFFGDARWDLSISASPPAQESNPPSLYINFTSTDGRNGHLYIRRNSDGKKFFVGGGGILPIPNSTAIFGEYDMNGYEDAIRRIFQRLMEGQLSQSPTPTPTPTPSPTAS